MNIVQVEMSEEVEMVDCLQRSMEFDTFNYPKEEIKKAKRGDDVKVIFENKSGKGLVSGERLWVIVTKRDGDNFVGKIDNEPLTPSLSLGQEIKFTAKNICQVF